MASGAGAVWVTGSYDLALRLTYWGTGNPSAPSARAGSHDLLFTNSVVALDVATGALKWHYQVTPNDQMDWDAAHVPVLVDLDWEGRRRKLLLMVNENGVLYVLDRETSQFLDAKPFVTVNWLDGSTPMAVRGGSLDATAAQMLRDA